MVTRKNTCWLVDLGLIAYESAFELQRRLVSARKAGLVPDVLLLCQHPHAITLGRNARAENLLASRRLLQQMNVEVCATDRGGDVTYHGPGQIVGYPILNLAEIRRDVGWYMRRLEEVLICATAEFGIAAGREPGMPGVWVQTAEGAPRRAEKLAALGVHLSRWVTSHGFAYNVSTDLRYFDLIVPCGLHGKRATSLERLLGRAVHRDDVALKVVRHFAQLFDRDMHEVPREMVDENLQEQEPLPHVAV